MEKLEHGLNLTYIKCHLRKKNEKKCVLIIQFDALL